MPLNRFRILALGDSYTIGEGVPAGQSWPAQLAERLRKEGLPVAKPLVIARTGWTTADLQNGIAREKPEGAFDLVTLSIGVNNQYRGLSADEYRTQFGVLLATSMVFTGGRPQRLIVLSIPDWGVTPYAHNRQRDQIAAEIDVFNHINLEETVAASVRYVDVTPVSRQAAGDSQWLAADGLHPSAKMYTVWVELLLPEVRRILDDYQNLG